jgi:hypothetical protein
VSVLKDRESRVGKTKKVTVLAKPSLISDGFSQTDTLGKVSVEQWYCSTDTFPKVSVYLKTVTLKKVTVFEKPSPLKRCRFSKNRHLFE